MPNDKLAEILSCAVRFSIRLGQACPEFPRSTEKLIGIVTQYLSLNGEFSISFHPRNYEARGFLGTVEIYDNDAHIYYDLDRNLCWRRFIVTKELCHILYFDNGEKGEPCSPDTITQLIDTIVVGLDKADLVNDNQAKSETLTMFMALEILLPNSERQTIQKMLENNGDVMSVATKYRIPVQFVRMYLVDKYSKLMDEAYRVLDICEAALASK